MIYITSDWCHKGGGDNDRGKLDRGYPAFAAGHSDGGEPLVGAEQFVDALEIGVDSLRRLEKVFSQHIVAQAAGLGAGSAAPRAAGIYQGVRSGAAGTGHGEGRHGGLPLRPR